MFQYNHNSVTTTSQVGSCGGERAESREGSWVDKSEDCDWFRRRYKECEVLVVCVYLFLNHSTNLPKQSFCKKLTLAQCVIADLTSYCPGKHFGLRV